MGLTIGTQQQIPHPGTWIIWQQDQILTIDGQLPTSDQGLALTNRRPVGLLNAQPCQCAELIGPAPAGSEWRPIRALLADMAPDQQQAVARARQLLTFEHEHRYCGACASPLQANRHDSGKHCPSCNAQVYPRLAPAMMVAIVRADQILLARAPHFQPGVYSALAGFVEPGETLEQCVHRETLEEVGVRIHNLRYVASQSWPFPHSLMLAFVADYLDGEIVPQAGEIEDARWFDLAALPTLPSRASIAWGLIQQVLTQHQSHDTKPKA